MVRGFGRAPRLLALFALASASWSTSARPTHAYSSFADYIRPIQEGGGGGRLFSGTPSDGYGCDVCHTGASGAKLEVWGLPNDGYVPGATYEILLRWPEQVPHIALMAELTDERGQASGTTALVPYGEWQPGETCENGFPAADVCQVGSTTDGCCRDFDPNRDGCSLPGPRSVLWVLDCGSRFARVRWTAPAVGNSDVWFSTEMVTSNLQNDAVGDGVTSLRRRIRPQGSPREIRSAIGDCRIAPAIDKPPPTGMALASLVLCAWACRPRVGRRRTRRRPATHVESSARRMRRS